MSAIEPTPERNDGATTVPKAVLLGLGRGLGHPGMVVWLWLLSLAVALPAVWVMADSLHDSFETSRVQENLRSGFDMGWYGEFRSDADGLAKTFDPTLLGAGAFYKNFEDWISGDLFRGFSGLVGLGLIYMLLWALLLGGVLQRFARPREKLGMARWMQAGGSFFFRFVRLALLSAPLYWLVFRLHGWSNEWLDSVTRDVTSESTVLVFGLIAIGVTIFLLSLVHVCFAYAKIATVLEDRRSMLFAAARGIRFVFSNPAKTLGVYYLMLAGSALLLAVYAWVAPGPAQAAPAGVLVAFLAGQAYLVAKLIARLSLLGGEMALYRGLSAERADPGSD